MLSLPLGGAPGRTISLLSSRTRFAKAFYLPLRISYILTIVSHTFDLCALVDYLTKQHVAWRAILQSGLGYLKKSLLKCCDKKQVLLIYFSEIYIKIENKNTSTKCKPIQSSLKQIHIESSKIISSLLWCKQNYHKLHPRCPYPAFKYNFKQSKIIYLYLKVTGHQYTVFTDDFKCQAIERLDT